MSKEVKTVLKQIRETIKNKKYAEAIKQCEEFLFIDPQNYMALVLMGAAYQEVDKKMAFKFLTRAVQCAGNVEPTLALQGLSNCATIEELPKIYKNLLLLVPIKFQEYHEKLVNIANEYTFNECCDILGTEIDLSENDKNYGRLESALQSLGKIFCKIKQVPEYFNQKYVIIALEKILHLECSSKSKLSCFKLYFKQLYKNNYFEKLLKSACNMLQQFPNDANALEWICQVYITQYKTLDIKSYIEKPIEFYVNKLLTIDKSSTLAFLVQAIVFYDNGLFIQSRDILVRIKNKSLETNKLLARIYIKLGSYGLAENIYRQLNIKNTEFGVSLCYSDDEKTALEGIAILNELDQNEIVLYALGRAYFKINDENKLEETFRKINKLENLELSTMFKIDFLLSNQEGIKYLQAVNASTFELELRKGKLYIETNQYEQSLYPLLRATKLKPYFSDCFLFLGICYQNTNNITRAKKCFDKCINLNPGCQLAVKHLCAINRRRGEFDLNNLLLSNVANQLQGPQKKWILYQQGLNFLDIDDCDQAIQSLRTAIKYDMTNILYWETLADAYYERGSYNSAIRVYHKILHIKPNNKYAKLQIAIIKRILHLYKESIGFFMELLSEDETYLPALKGITEVYYEMANCKLQQSLLGRCKSNLQTALDYLQKIFLNYQHKNFIWLWRLAANIFVLVGSLPSRLSFLKFNGSLVKQGSRSKSIFLYRTDLFKLALKCYTCALRLCPNDYFVWQEISLCAYFFILCERNDNKMNLMKMAIQTCKTSIKCQSGRWQTWNFLGVLYALKAENLKPNFSLAQHYFVKSLQLDNNSAVTWANLGALYLLVGEINLANRTFKRSQESDPSYINGWIGQATIAELISENEEAMDLFRHCTQLNFHLESALGYAYWVCKVLTDENLLQESHYQYAINNLHAISHASDSICWYISAEDNKASIESLSYYGYLLSKQKLWLSAIKVYELAIEKACYQQKEGLLFNLGFCYLMAKKPKLAIKSFRSLTEVSMKSLIGLALSHCRDKNYQQAYETYTCGLDWLALNDEEKGQLLIATSAILYAFQGEKDTKSVLYQCLDLEHRPVEGLFSACALGIVHLDSQLAESILDELKILENDIKYCHHIAFLTSQYFYAMKQSKRAYFYLLSMVHYYPERFLLRKVLADFTINYLSKTNKYSKTACQVAQSVIILQQKVAFSYDSLDAAKALLTASEAIKNFNREKQIKLIQKSIHTNPDFKLAWMALSAIRI